MLLWKKQERWQNQHDVLHWCRLPVSQQTKCACFKLGQTCTHLCRLFDQRIATILPLLKENSSQKNRKSCMCIATEETLIPFIFHIFAWYILCIQSMYHARIWKINGNQNVHENHFDLRLSSISLHASMFTWQPWVYQWLSLEKLWKISTIQVMMFPAREVLKKCQAKLKGDETTLRLV